MKKKVYFIPAILFLAICFVLFEYLGRTKPKKVKPLFYVEGKVTEISRFSQDKMYVSTNEKDLAVMNEVISGLYDNVTNERVTDGVEGGMWIDFCTDLGEKYSLTCVGGGASIYSEKNKKLVYFDISVTDYKKTEELFLGLVNKKNLKNK